MDSALFVSDLLKWYEVHKRNLPWRRDSDPYRVWVSEVMLQQTRVDAVVPYYERFMRLFPDLQALAAASEDAVVKAWEGLGYYSRARNLQQAVREVTDRYGGVVPDTFEDMTSLRGVGPYTAGAVLSIAYGKPLAAVDGNVLRVFSRLLLITEDIARPAVKNRIAAHVTALIPAQASSAFNQALMELGALVCVPRSPKCEACPVAAHCAARQAGCQAGLPHKAAKKPVRHEHYAVLLMRDSGGALAVSQRPATGLLRGLWQLPMVRVTDATADPDEICEQVRETCGTRGIALPTKVHVQGVYTHAFTHLHWTLRAVVADAVPDRQPDELLFADAAARAQLAFGRIFQVILQDLAEEVEHRPERRGGNPIAILYHRDF